MLWPRATFCHAGHPLITDPATEARKRSFYWVLDELERQGDAMDAQFATGGLSVSRLRSQREVLDEVRDVVTWMCDHPDEAKVLAEACHTDARIVLQP